ncbi:MAG: diguanylate cyclase [Myxococcota bacterium]|nr:diguanylate cyclase [Myxococcota bacterium]
MGIALPALAVSVAGVGFFWRQASEAVEQSTAEQADAVAELIASAFTLAQKDGGTSRQEAHRSVTQALRSDWSMFQYVQELRILDRQGTVSWSRKLEEEGRPLPGAEQILGRSTRVEGTRDGQWQIVRPLGGVACAGCHPTHTMKVGVLALTINQPKLQQEVTGVFQSALAAVLIFGGVLALATGISLRLFLTRPIRILSSAMHRAEAGDLLVRARTEGDDELGQLSRSFNQMLARLTTMKAEEIDKNRDLQAAQDQLRLQEALEHRVRALSLLYDVARSFTSTLELPEVLGRITQLVATRLEIPQFSVMLETGDGRLEVKSAFPTGEGTEGLIFSFGEGACGMAAQSRTSVYLPDLGHESAIYVRRGHEEQGSLFSVPMIHKDRVLGVLNFQRPVPNGFEQEEMDLLTAVADQAALAVQNAKLHEETVGLSLTDALTGAPNRRFLFSRLENEIARANRFGNQVSVLMIDIDHFKLLNDSAGHRAGDQVLKQVYELMSKMIRKVDTLARYGGEEFMVLLAQVPKHEAHEVAEKLRRAVAEAPWEHGRTQPTGRITVSIGVANLPVDAIDLERLVDSADSALYASKRGGRDKVTSYAAGMEQHPGRERGPNAIKKIPSGTHAAVPAVAPEKAGS